MNRNRIKVWKDNRIYYYDSRPSADYWDDHWKESITEKFYKKYQDGNLDEYSNIFLKYLKINHRILEAGCGTGRYVLALKSRGFAGVEGIEWGSSTVKLIKDLFPDIPITEGDVTNISVPDNHYDIYISLGVVEHREKGPEPFLSEAYRVLKTGGKAILTVPFVNHLRYIKGRLGFYKNGQNNYEFYQYAFSKEEFCQYLIKSGFCVLETRSLAGYYGLKEELPGLFIFLDKFPGGWRLKNILKNSSWINIFGHICCFVCTKP